MFDLSTLKLNPQNPFPSTKDGIKELADKIKKYPKFLKLRPIVYDPNTKMILGGNKRYEALLSLGYKQVPQDYVKPANELTEEEKRNFIFADNKEYGYWNMEFITEEEAENWELNLFFEDEQEIEEKEESFKDEMKITLNYTEDEYRVVKDALLSLAKTPEAAVWNLLDEKGLIVSVEKS